MENRENINGKKIKDVVVGVHRSFGSFQKVDAEGKPVKERGRAVYVDYDSVTLYTVPYYSEYSDDDRGIYCAGFCPASAKNPVISATKVKTEVFEEIFGIELADFLVDFEEKYMFHPCRIMYGMSDRGDPVPCQIVIFDQDIYSMLNPPEIELKDGEKLAEVTE